MMFGAWGNTHHDDCIRIIHRALDAGINFVDTADIYSQGESDVGIEETLGALTDLVRQGKVRYIGSSVFPPSAIVEAQWAARERGLQRYVCEQPPYSADGSARPRSPLRDDAFPHVGAASHRGDSPPAPRVSGA